MKVAIVGSASSIDNEICLIQSLQRKGIEFRYYFFANNKNTPLFRLEEEYPNQIIPASRIKEFNLFKDYIRLDNVFMLCCLGLRFRNPKFLWVYIKLVFELLKYNPDVIHFTWPQIRTAAITYMLPYKIVMTVHDPIPHSSHRDKVVELYRKLAFLRADRLILLNNIMTDNFCNRYKIKPEKIRYSRLGVFDYLDHYPKSEINVKGKYFLFFGQIASYKGLEFLLPAMVKVHSRFPDWKLVVAGGGKFYFDIAAYKKLDYIEIRNYFIDMPELVGLLRGCEFAVAPYKDATQSGLLLNALSVGKPMIVTNVGNLSEMIGNGRRGIVVPPCDIEALQEAIEKMMGNPIERQRMTDNINNEWRKKMDWAEIVMDYIDIYNN